MDPRCLAMSSFPLYLYRFAVFSPMVPAFRKMEGCGVQDTVIHK